MYGVYFLNCSYLDETCVMKYICSATYKHMMKVRYKTRSASILHVSIQKYLTTCAYDIYCECHVVEVTACGNSTVPYSTDLLFNSIIATLLG